MQVRTEHPDAGGETGIGPRSARRQRRRNRKLLIASGAAGAKAVRWYHSPTMTCVYKAFDWMVPGQFSAFAHRKAFCERQARKGIAAGADQVLVLGAGYGTMGWRLAPEFPEVDFFEFDHPATACLKAKGIKRMGPRPNLHLIAADLSERKLNEVLTGTILNCKVLDIGCGTGDNSIWPAQKRFGSLARVLRALPWRKQKKKLPKPALNAIFCWLIF